VFSQSNMSVDSKMKTHSHASAVEYHECCLVCCRRAVARHLWTIEDWAALKTQAGGKEHLWSPKYALPGDDGTWCASRACGLQRPRTCLPKLAEPAVVVHSPVDCSARHVGVKRSPQFQAFGSPPVSMLRQARLLAVRPAAVYKPAHGCTSEHINRTYATFAAGLTKSGPLKTSNFNVGVGTSWRRGTAGAWCSGCTVRAPSHPA